jgi:hypothetical protein
MKIPCIHTASPGAIKTPEITQFTLPVVGPDLEIRTFEGNWPFGLTKCKSVFPAEDNSEEVDQSAESQDLWFINRVYRDLQKLHPRKELNLSRRQMAYELGRTIGREEAATGRSELPEEARIHLRSRFFIDVVKTLKELQ